jgi:hypothetical protein
MKNKPKRESKKLLCPKACVLNQLDDDRLNLSLNLPDSTLDQWSTVQSLRIQSHSSQCY